MPLKSLVFTILQIACKVMKIRDLKSLIFEYFGGHYREMPAPKLAPKVLRAWDNERVGEHACENCPY